MTLDKIDLYTKITVATGDVERLDHPSPEELDALTALWEASVRATHHFLNPAEIPIYRIMVRAGGLESVQLYVVHAFGGVLPKKDGSIGESNKVHAEAINGNRYGGFAAFAGVVEDKLEMLFVAPENRGQGLGRKLVEYVVGRCGVVRVDVNEQNDQALGFYERLGFRSIGRDAIDPSGKPYPILHMKLLYAAESRKTNSDH